MADKTVHVVLIEGFADWEHALPLAQLRLAHGFETIIVGVTPEVRSLGGLRVLCDTTVEKVRPEDVRTLVIIGGSGWEAREQPAVTRLIHEVWAKGARVAAICGGTTAVAHAGLLDAHAHTSNGLDFLRQTVPGYRGAERYRDALVIRDGRLITAPGEGYAEFGRELLAALEVMPPEQLTAWFAVVKHGQKYAA